MKLLTKKIENELIAHPIGSTDGQGKNAKVIVKFFGGSSCTWLVTEGEKLENGDWQFFGMCHITNWEWGYFLLSQLKELKFPPFGLPIERDLYSHGSVKELMK